MDTITKVDSEGVPLFVQRIMFDPWNNFFEYVLYNEETIKLSMEQLRGLGLKINGKIGIDVLQDAYTLGQNYIKVNWHRYSKEPGKEKALSPSEEQVAHSMRMVRDQLDAVVKYANIQGVRIEVYYNDAARVSDPYEISLGPTLQMANRISVERALIEDKIKAAMK